MEENQETKTGEKTFSQEAVNRIVSERLAKERSKGDPDLEKRAQELQQKENRLYAKEMLIDRGLSVELLDALNCSDEETTKKSIEVIENIMKTTKSSPITLRGVEPGNPSNGAKESGNRSLREAMGLHK